MPTLYRPPSRPAELAAEVARRARTGCCVVCSAPTRAPGVTCKSKRCIALWLFGRLTNEPAENLEGHEFRR